MLQFSEQKLILDSILSHPGNHICADCDQISPTWASINIGVFLCGNCAQAHKVLGPCFAKIKSVHLDRWSKDQLSHMRIGNLQLNNYWEENPSHKQQKAKVGHQFSKYVCEKYIEKKYVLNHKLIDPLTSYKKQHSKQSQRAQPQYQKTELNSLHKGKDQHTRQEQVPKDIKKQANTLQFQEDTNQKPLSKVNQLIQESQVNHTQQPRTQFAQRGTSFTSETSKDNVFFAGLESIENTKSSLQHKAGIHHCLSDQNLFQTHNINNINLHHPFNSNIGQHNIVYNSYFQSPQMNSNEFSHLNHQINHKTVKSQHKEFFVQTAQQNIKNTQFSKK